MPLTSTQIKYGLGGMIFSGAQQVANYACTEMMKNDTIDWDHFKSPGYMAWFSLMTAAGSVGYGALAYAMKTQAVADERMLEDNFDEPENPTPVSEPKCMHKRSTVMAASVAGITAPMFTYLALTTPINATNALYMAGSTLTTSIPFGFVAGSVTYMLMLKSRLSHQHLPMLQAHDDVTPTESPVVTPKEAKSESFASRFLSKFNIFAKKPERGLLDDDALFDPNEYKLDGNPEVRLTVN